MLGQTTYERGKKIFCSSGQRGKLLEALEGCEDLTRYHLCFETSLLLTVFWIVGLSAFSYCPQVNAAGGREGKLHIFTYYGSQT